MEGKETASRSFSVIFQDRHFRRCIGLSHWLRWGEFVFDVRPLREYLGLPKEDKYLYLKVDKSTFEKRIKEITDAVGERNFIMVNIETNKMIESGNDNKNELGF